LTGGRFVVGAVGDDACPDVVVPQSDVGCMLLRPSAPAIDVDFHSIDHGEQPGKRFFNLICLQEVDLSRAEFLQNGSLRVEKNIVAEVDYLESLRSKGFF
jgi:hypothetical protein